MPIYEYQCQSCGEHTEVIQKLSDAPLVDCPACGESAMKKKVSAAAFRLKGGGWYETDFKTGDKKNLAGEAGGKNGKGDADSKAGDNGAASKASGDSKPGNSKSGDSGSSSEKTA